MTALLDQHVAVLAARGIPAEAALAAGVRSISNEVELPAGCPDYWRAGNNYLPGLLFTWTAEDGRVEYQIRPDEDHRPTNGDGDPVKYAFRRRLEDGYAPVLWVAKRGAPDGVRLLTEGTCQTLAAAIHAPEGVWVLGMAGCQGWMSDGAPVVDLHLLAGHEVVVAMDADLWSNRNVWDASEVLGRALEIEGAHPVRYLRLPASKTTGLDDLLAGRSESTRSAYLARLIDTAAKERFPASRRPKPKTDPVAALATDGRPIVVTNNDRLRVITELTEALRERWDGTELFNHGDVLSRLVGHELRTLDKGTFLSTLVETASTVDASATSAGVTYAPSWPDANTILAVLSGADKFTPLDQVRRVPFVRPDGTICSEPGYDEASRTLLVLGDEVFGSVPDDPGRDEIDAARELLMTELLGDMPFATEADRTNALALMLTPFVRGMLDRVPMCVIDGLQMGVGKNKLADCLAILATGQRAEPISFIRDEEEARKQLTAAFITGAELFVFDEAHTIEGAKLAQALTTTIWQDRVLGYSLMGNYPNRVTWVALGNQVQVNGDLTRRVYRVALRPTYANPQDRPANLFRHPGVSGLSLEEWARVNRGRLVVAALTLIRAWFVAGKPAPSRGVSFGSFEAWERMLGGIVEHAGATGFLGNLLTWRSESDFESQEWVAHLMWLHETFGEEEFTAARVKGSAMTALHDYAAPPGLDDPAPKGYAKALGQAYSRRAGRDHEGYTMVKAGVGHRKVARWRVAGQGLPVTTTYRNPDMSDNDPILSGGREGPGGTPTLSAYEKSNGVTSNEVVTTGDVDHVNGDGGENGVSTDCDRVITQPPFNFHPREGEWGSRRVPPYLHPETGHNPHPSDNPPEPPSIEQQVADAIARLTGSADDHDE